VSDTPLGTAANQTQALQWGVAARSLDGGGSSGDAYLVTSHPKGMLVVVIDALGHGPEAAAPAALAAAEVAKRPHESLPIIVQRCHEALLTTRGVVMSLASFDFAERAMTWVGIGDVAGVLVFGDPTANPSHTVLVHRGGIVGGRLPQQRPWVIPLSDGDTLIFATDGVQPGFEAGLVLHADPSRTANAILEKHSKGTDDALVLVARFGAARVRVS
jgi:negative regulator of sigma-B (phosphoserine phosphatase)